MGDLVNETQQVHMPVVLFNDMTRIATKSQRAIATRNSFDKSGLDT